MEQRGELDRRELMTRAHQLLPELYHAALSLPVVRPSGDLGEDDDDDLELEHERWATVHDELKELLGDADHYLDVYDPIQRKADVLDWSLAEDLADIYRSVKEGLTLAEESGAAAPAGVVWAWRFHWEHDWGRHALGAIRALYARLTDYYVR